MKRILVTGGAGYIGNFVVSQLLTDGYEVVVLDKLIYGDSGITRFQNNEKFSLIVGDIRDEEDIDKSLSGVDGVIALAAIVGDPACNVNKDTTYTINYKANELLVKKCIERNIKRLVFASSCSVYGKMGEAKTLTEESPLNPVSWYAETRVMSEQLLHKHQTELSSVILRLSTIFGLSDRMRFDLAVNIMSAKAAIKEPVEIFGGKQWRPFLHCRDAARAFVAALKAPDKLVRGQVFNVGSNRNNYRILEIGEAIKDQIPQSVVRQSSVIDDERDYHVCFDKIKQVLNFDTKENISNGVKEIYGFVSKEQMDIYKDVYHNVKVWKNIDKDRILPFAVPDVSDDEKLEIWDTLDSGWLSTGPKSQRFARAVKEYLGDDELFCIPVSSCTAGLHLQLLGYNIGPGDEVITTPLTFTATVSTIIQTGAKPVLVDIDPKTYNIDYSKIEEKITKNTKAIVPVYYSGNALQYEKLQALARKYNLLILADAAHGIGGEYKGAKFGTYEDSAAFSFYATKNLTTGEGGLVTTKNPEVADKISRMVSFGMNRNAWKRYSNTGSWYYEITDLGFKYNFTDIQAALGLQQLKKIDSFNERRREICELYDNEFNQLGEVITPNITENSLPTRHLYPFLIEVDKMNINRDEFIKKLREKNILTSVHYVPIHLHPYYQKKLGLQNGMFEHTEWFYNREISLPLHTKMKDEDVERVIKAVKDIIITYKK